MKPLRMATDFSVTPQIIQAGGIESSAKNQVEKLRTSGFKIFPIRFRIMNNDNPPKLNLIKSDKSIQYEITVPKKTIEAFINKKFSWRKLDQKIINTYKDFFIKTRPDLVLINGFPWFQYYLAQAAKKNKIPFIILHHGLVYKELSFVNIPPAARNRIALWEKASSMAAIGEIFITQQSLKVWQSRYSNPDPKHNLVVTLPINDVFFKKSNKKNLKTGDRKKIHLGWVGRWDAIKRPDYIFSLASLLKKTHETQAVTRITKNPLISVSEKDFSKIISLKQPMPPNKLRDFYHSLDACILPSAFESMGKVILEAAACGIPTFITPAVGLADVYKATGMENFILKGDNPKADAKQISAQKKLVCTKAFLNYVKQEHSSKLNFPRLTKTIHEILK